MKVRKKNVTIIEFERSVCLIIMVFLSFYVIDKKNTHVYLFFRMQVLETFQRL